MVTVLDSRQLTGADRRPAAVVARLQAGMGSRVWLREPAAPVQVRLDAWELGGLPVLRADVVGPLAVGRRRPPPDAPPVVSLYVQEHGTGRHEQGGRQRALTPGTLAVTDVTSPYSFAWGDTEGAGRALQIPVARLGLSVDVVRRAAPHVADSPLYELVRAHVAQVTRDAERLTADPGWPALSVATVELARALVISAADADGTTCAVPGETLLTRIRTWVDQHLTDPDLDAARVAAEHTISVRQLYRLCSAAGFSLEQWVIDQRLEGARAELARPGGRPIAAVARSWGFSDPSHFSRRFRAAFGTTPREWRDQRPPPVTPPPPGAVASASARARVGAGAGAGAGVGVGVGVE
ncbi:helix-turn-helix domain-containing protein [Modestobacter sp. VKM Ac-2980]|uniref:helix-turn-helix domain-containing protein n=1 Tax=Modestobacter sp. VKM Ac-2980 TaxID=3004134 RepID=UPI0022AB92F6|nr:helix-turn-helix domain-containing protein [Modestobacter sp. VKM Ac-2980]MCZ2843191.1 helix-turn-helix domain-containing protein [Modestobacter sp. VKM Ac-2980]